MKQTNTPNVITAYDKSELVDPNRPREERIAEFVRQIKNPYHFRCGGFTIHAKYAPDGPPLEDCLRQALT